jgi:hypothetical protein
MAKEEIRILLSSPFIFLYDPSVTNSAVLIILRGNISSLELNDTFEKTGQSTSKLSRRSRHYMFDQIKRGEPLEFPVFFCHKIQYISLPSSLHASSWGHECNFFSAFVDYQVRWVWFSETGFLFRRRTKCMEVVLDEEKAKIS